VKVTFVKKGARRYAVEVGRDRYPDLWCGSIGYDDWLPHDLLHFFAEAEYGLDGGVFGDLAAGGNARIFQPVDAKLVAKMWRKQRIARTRCRWAARSRSNGRGPRAESAIRPASGAVLSPRDGVSVRACLPARAVPA